MFFFFILLFDFVDRTEVSNLVDLLVFEGDLVEHPILHERRNKCLRAREFDLRFQFIQLILEQCQRFRTIDSVRVCHILSVRFQYFERFLQDRTNEIPNFDCVFVTDRYVGEIAKNVIEFLPVCHVLVQVNHAVADDNLHQSNERNHN